MPPVPASPDLDALAAMLDKMTPGPWLVRGVMITRAGPGWVACVPKTPRPPDAFTCGLTDDSTDAQDAQAIEDAAGIVALVNTAPALIARCRDLERALLKACANWSRTMSSLDKFHEEEEGVLRRSYDRMRDEAEVELVRLRAIARPGPAAVCVDCDGMGRTRTDGGHGNIIDEECSTCRPGPAAGEEG